MSLTQQPATRLLADLQSGILSAADLMQATLDRIEAVNPTVNAIVALRDPDALIAEAKAMDSGEIRGPLHGLPFAVKDTASAEGLPTSMGSPILAGRVAEADEPMVARIRAAGAIFIGKTNVPEFGLGSHTFNPVFGATKNPYDTTKSAGGSSGGAAVALATALTALADGSDIMGSLRNPAAWNNVYGMRPTWSLVPASGKGDLFLSQLAAAGPMARSPADLALLLDVMAGPDSRQPHGVAIPPISPLHPAELAGTRIGWLGDWGGVFPTEAGILELCETALGALADLGAEIVPVAPVFSAEAMWDSWVTLRSWETAMRLMPYIENKAMMKDSAIWELERGMALSGMDVYRASLIRSDWFTVAADLFSKFDALALPSTQVWPFDANIPYPTEIAGHAMETYHRWMEVVVPASLIGLPALAVPAGFGSNGLPGGIQLFGRRGSDAALLALGAAYHEATGWPQKRPPVLNLEESPR